MLNLHHLELFYYVARHQGVSRAVRNMPYGIQQPAVSSQLAQLEKSLGVQLFQRRPFVLTPAGQQLWQFIAPFLGNLDDVAERVRHDSADRLRVAASPVVIREHLPALFLQLKQAHPGLRLGLYEANQARAEALLLSQEADLAISALEEKPSLGMKFQKLLELPMILLAPQGATWHDIRGFSPKLTTHPLISLPPTAALSRLFQAELDRRRILWPTQIEVDSLDMVQAYVAKGFGLGLSVRVPDVRLPATVRVLPLRGFQSIQAGIIWRNQLSPIAESFLRLAHEYVRRLTNG